MIKKFWPKLMLKSIYDINLDDLEKLDIKILLFDLDGTLVEENVEKACKKLISWLNRAKKRGFLLYIVSNNNEERVKIFAKQVKISYISSAYKPLTFKIKKLIRKINDEIEKDRKIIRNDQIALIGDQIFTDIIVGNKLKMYTILVRDSLKPKRILRNLIFKVENMILKTFK